MFRQINLPSYLFALVGLQKLYFIFFYVLCIHFQSIECFLQSAFTIYKLINGKPVSWLSIVWGKYLELFPSYNCIFKREKKKTRCRSRGKLIKWVKWYLSFFLPVRNHYSASIASSISVMMRSSWHKYSYVHIWSFKFSNLHQMTGQTANGTSITYKSCVNINVPVTYLQLTKSTI